MLDEVVADRHDPVVFLPGHPGRRSVNLEAQTPVDQRALTAAQARPIDDANVENVGYPGNARRNST